MEKMKEIARMRLLESIGKVLCGALLAVMLVSFASIASAAVIPIRGNVCMNQPASLSYSYSATNYDVYVCTSPHVEVRIFPNSSITMTYDELVASRRKLVQLLSNGRTMSTANYTGLALVITKDSNSGTYNKPVTTVDFIVSGYLVTIDIHDLDCTSLSDNYITNLIKSIYIDPNMKNGWVEEGDNTYYYSNGVKLVGVNAIGSEIYWFNEDGVLQYGWLEASDESGYYFWGPEMLRDGIYQIDEEKYYFSEEGLTITGWMSIDNQLYFFSPMMCHSNAFYIDDELYCFNDDGTLFKNGLFHIEENDITLYANSDGTAFTGWKTINQRKYYFDLLMYYGDIFVIDDMLYYFNDDGSLFTNGIFEYDGDKYYAALDGSLFEGWKTIGGKKYYFGYSMCTSYAYYIEDALFCFNDDGSLFTGGWYHSGTGDYFWTDRSGISNLGWKPDENKWYYVVDADGDGQISYNTLFLPEQSEIIEEYAFEGSAAQVVVIPPSCKKICKGAFSNCPNLRYIVNFSESVSIDSDAYDKQTCQLIDGPQ